jgi:hypothetical protein
LETPLATLTADYRAYDQGDTSERGNRLPWLLVHKYIGLVERCLGPLACEVARRVEFRAGRADPFAQLIAQGAEVGLRAVGEAHLQFIQQGPEFIADIVGRVTATTCDALRVATRSVQGVIYSISGMKKRGHGVLLLVNEKNRAKCAMETHVSKSGARPPDMEIFPPLFTCARPGKRLTRQKVRARHAWAMK